MTCFLIRDYNILAEKELHRSLQVYIAGRGDPKGSSHFRSKDFLWLVIRGFPMDFYWGPDGGDGVWGVLKGSLGGACSQGPLGLAGI